MYPFLKRIFIDEPSINSYYIKINEYLSDELNRIILQL